MTDQSHLTGPSTGSLLRCANVRVRFGGVVALDNVSLDVPAGQVVGIIGPNGAGKTTLFNCISRLYSVESGDIVFADQSLLGQPRHRIAELGIARTFQNVALFETMTVKQNVVVGAHCRTGCGFLSDSLKLAAARKGASIRDEADEIMEFLQLTGEANRLVRDLPFGTRKRVELARALASKPRLLMLDEPAGGLNHIDVDDLRELIGELRERFGLTVLLVEHHMQFVMKLCDKIIALNFGKGIATGTPAEIRQHPEVIRAYLGSAA
jgi:branched-chain amino acid transport system ATP-binding protein